MTSSVSELLMQDSSSGDVFKTISESVETSSEVIPGVSLASYSDDAIGDLLEQMVKILPPEERNILGTNEQKDIQEIIEEANELIRATTPLFSSSESCGKTLSHKSKTKTSKTNQSSREDTENVVSLNEKFKSNSISSSLESILVKDGGSPAGNTESPSISLTNIVSLKVINQRGCPVNPIDEGFCNDSIIKSVEEVLEIESSSNMRSQLEYRSTSNTEPLSNEKHKLNPQLESKHNQRSKSINANESYNAEERNNETMLPHSASFHGLRGAESKLKLTKPKYISEIEAMKLAHAKEIQEYNEQINKLNIKIYDYQKCFNVGFARSPEKRNQQLEQFQNEIRHQERLIAGYEQDNKKLCYEISNLKAGWKQRESKFLEEKQRMQNELLGMVSRGTTEALEEKLKDCQETIVKLEVELTTNKGRNKELEAANERLRGDVKRLQCELSNCRCDRGTPHRDRYSLQASTNVGSQIQELKSDMARKDLEISQLTTTMGILKGELSNKEVMLVGGDDLDLTVSQLQTALAVQRQATRDLTADKDALIKENLDLKRQVRELEAIVRRRQKSDSCFPVPAVTSDPQTTTRLHYLEKKLSSSQESLTTLHTQLLNMQKKYEDHINELENRLRESQEELKNIKGNQKKEEAKSNLKRLKQGSVPAKEETHLLATIRGLRQEAASREKEIVKLNKEIEEVKQTNRRLQREREKQLNTMPAKMSSIREKAFPRKLDQMSNAPGSRTNLTSPNNNVNTVLLAELQEKNIILKSQTKSLQEEVKRLEQDLITMHNKRVHDLNMMQSEHESEVKDLVEERASYLAQSSASELQGQLYTQQMVISHLKNRLRQMEELKSEVTLLRAERDHLEESLAAVNSKMSFLQSAHSPESGQYKTLLAKLETLEKNQEVREQKLNAVRELLSRSTQGTGQCGGTCRDRLLDKNRQICFYRAQMDRILEALLELRRTK